LSTQPLAADDSPRERSGIARLRSTIGTAHTRARQNHLSTVGYRRNDNPSASAGTETLGSSPGDPRIDPRQSPMPPQSEGGRNRGARSRDSKAWLDER